MITRYIESTSDAIFTINAKVLGAFRFKHDGLEFSVDIEGQPVAGILIDRKKSYKRSAAIKGQTVLEDMEWKLRPFQFCGTNVGNQIPDILIQQV